MSGKGRWLGPLVLAALMTATLVILLRRQPFSALAADLGGLRVGYVALGLGLMLSFECCEAACTKLILGCLGHAVPYRRCLGYSFVGFYVSSVTPSSTGGQPAQIYYMSRDGVPAAHATLNMLLLAVSYQVTALACGAAAALTCPGLLPALGTGWALLLLCGASVMLALTAGMLCLMFLPRLARHLAEGALALLTRLRLVKDRAAAGERLEGQLAEYRRGAECIRAHPGLVPAVLGLTAVQLLSLFAVPWAVYLAFGLSGHSPWELIGMQALLTVATSALPLPGGVGASEGGFVSAFAAFFGEGLVTPAVLVSRGISFYSFLALSGIVTLVFHVWGGRKKQR